MEFCKKCGSLMLPRKTEEGIFLECTSCGKIEKAKDTKNYRAIEKSVAAEKEIPVIEEEAPATLPITKVTCPKCGNNRAYWWIKQTRAADEPSTRFYKCTKCGKVWREYA
ncbi:MAG: transcription factor S [Candidatus Hadarchaeales archaeon]